LKRSQQLDLSNYLPYLVNRFGAALVKWFSENALRGRHLSIVMWRVVAVLSSHDRVRMTDLSRLTSIEISTLSRIVTRLVTIGLVKRERRETNGREVIVGLSPQGVAVASEMIPIARELERAAVAGVPRKELETVKRTLETMHGNLAGRKPQHGTRTSAKSHSTRPRNR